MAFVFFWETLSLAEVPRNNQQWQDLPLRLYKTVANTAAKITWICKLLVDVGLILPCPPKLWCDNIYAISMAKNPIFHTITKYVEIDYHYIREKVIGQVKIQTLTSFTWVQFEAEYSGQYCKEKGLVFVNLLRGCYFSFVSFGWLNELSLQGYQYLVDIHNCNIIFIMKWNHNFPNNI